MCSCALVIASHVIRNARSQLVAKTRITDGVAHCLLSALLMGPVDECPLDLVLPWRQECPYLNDNWPAFEVLFHLSLVFCSPVVASSLFRYRKQSNYPEKLGSLPVQVLELSFRWSARQSIFSVSCAVSFCEKLLFLFFALYF